MSAYDPAPWHDLFVTTGGAAAALAGLLFVAVSLNLDDVLGSRALPALAGQSVALLVGLVLLSVLQLAPGQGRVALGVEDAVLGLLLAAATTVSTARVLGELERRSWRVQRILLGLVATLPIAVGGASLAAGVLGGLYWLLAAALLLFATASYNAWVLLVEIKR